jgi:hypothetical protein
MKTDPAVLANPVACHQNIQRLMARLGRTAGMRIHSNKSHPRKCSCA